jgi:putative FmdB family regulatory protein
MGTAEPRPSDPRNLRGRQGSPSKKERAMPDYEFQCSKCSKVFTDHETFAEHDKHPKVKCPECGSTEVRQVINPVGVKTSKKS